MTPDELLRRISTEPDQQVTRMVREVSRVVLMQAQQPAGLQLKDLLAAPACSSTRSFRYGHRLGEPAPQDALERWPERHGRELPVDLQEVLRRFDGIHLWANLETGRAYSGLAPLADWELGRTKMYGEGASPALLDDRFMAISYHQDASSFVTLDMESGGYFLMDTAGPDVSSRVATSAEELLDWLWSNRTLPA